jgi:hypothetical protein
MLQYTERVTRHAVTTPAKTETRELPKETLHGVGAEIFIDVKIGGNRDVPCWILGALKPYYRGQGYLPIQR